MVKTKKPVDHYHHPQPKNSKILLSLIFIVFILFSKLLVPKTDQEWSFSISPIEGVEDWKDVLYDPNIIKQIDEIISFSDIVEDYMKKDQENNFLSRHMIFYGPPGTGKSYSASAIAKSVGSHYKIVAAGGLQNRYVGTGAAKWSEIISESKKIAKKNVALGVKKPVFIIVEEIDSLCSKDYDSYSGYDDTLLNNFLESIDLIKRESLNIIVIGTTNYIEKIAPSAKRPGRLTKFLFNDTNNKDFLDLRVDRIKGEVENKFKVCRSIEEAKKLNYDRWINIENEFWMALKNENYNHLCSYVELQDQVLLKIKTKIELKNSVKQLPNYVKPYVVIVESDAEEIFASLSKKKYNEQ